MVPTISGTLNERCILLKVKKRWISKQVDITVNIALCVVEGDNTFVWYVVWWENSTIDEFVQSLYFLVRNIDESKEADEDGVIGWQEKNGREKIVEIVHASLVARYTEATNTSVRLKRLKSWQIWYSRFVGKINPSTRASLLERRETLLYLSTLSRLLLPLFLRNCIPIHEHSPSIVLVSLIGILAPLRIPNFTP